MYPELCDFITRLLKQIQTQHYLGDIYILGLDIALTQDEDYRLIEINRSLQLVGYLRYTVINLINNLL